LQAPRLLSSEGEGFAKDTQSDMKKSWVTVNQTDHMILSFYDFQGDSA
jgi:hypothetical protein